jgi:flagellar hook-basal body complex protein FliE
MIDSIAPAANTVSRNQMAPFINTVAPEAPAASTPDDFTGMISQMFTQTADALHTAETTSAAAIQGQASIQEVVQAVLGAQQSLNGAIAVRDKLTAAYLEISRMAI